MNKASPIEVLLFVFDVILSVIDVLASELSSVFVELISSEVSFGVVIILLCVVELLSVSVPELADGVFQRNINSITATIIKHKDKNVTKFDFFIFLYLSKSKI